MDFNATNIRQAEDIGRKCARAMTHNDIGLFNHWRKVFRGLLLIATNKAELESAYDRAYREESGQ